MDDRDHPRLDIARSETPRTLLWTAGLLVVFSALVWWAVPQDPAIGHLLDFGAAAVLLVAGLAILRAPLALRAVPWVAASAFATLGVAFLVQVVLNPDPVGMAYVAVVLTGLGPSVLDRPAFLTVGGALLAATVVTAELPDVGLGPAWVLPALAGFVFGTVLLTYRLRSITALGRANARAEELAASDSLTGLLNRYGLQRSGSDLTARAHARDEGIFVVFIDVDGLKQANDNHGHAFGDRVILAAASAARRLAAEGDLVARWGGDELVVVGVGPTPDPTSVTERLAAALDRTGLDRARWPGPLSVGVAGAPCEEGPLADLVDLVDRADRDMYRRRRDRRPGPSDLATPG